MVGNQARYLASLMEAETKFADDNYKGPHKGPMVHVLTGTTKCLLTAPHSTRHWMGHGRPKVHDRWTGGLVETLALTQGVPAIIRRRMGRFEEDSDVWEAVSTYVQTHRPQFILDIHACASSCPTHMVFGTSSQELDPVRRAHVITIREIAKAHGLTHQLKWTGEISPAQQDMLKVLRMQADQHQLAHDTNTISYAALSESSITTLASALGIPTIQIELRADARSPIDHPEGLLKTLAFLRASIQALL